MEEPLIDMKAWLAGYHARERGYGIPWGDHSARQGWLAAKAAEVRATCPRCGGEALVRPSGYLSSHNAPPNEHGYIANCGNRRPTLRKAPK
jgi:hypothetical protein